jgi:hypothetical protein
MPNQRGLDQTLINIPMDEGFKSFVNAAVTVSGYPDRAKFIRDAIVEKCLRLGIHIPKKLSNPPSRLGKGGANSPPISEGEKDEKRNISDSSGRPLSSKVIGALQQTEYDGAALMMNEPAKPAPSPAIDGTIVHKSEPVKYTLKGSSGRRVSPTPVPISPGK